MLKSCETLIILDCAKFEVVVFVVAVVVVVVEVVVVLEVEEVVIGVVVVSKAIETGTYNLVDRPKILTTSIKLVKKRATMSFS